MQQSVIWRRMAEKWREAADEVAEPALRHCYGERAASYERMAAREGTGGACPTGRARNRCGKAPIKEA
jgi:hypothetical protein